MQGHASGIDSCNTRWGSHHDIFSAMFFKYFKNVVLPVPALPVRKMFSLVSVTTQSKSKTSFLSNGDIFFHAYKKFNVKYE
jgi:hypothetical protein